MSTGTIASMPCVLAIVSKATFQQEARSDMGLLAVGDTYRTSTYRSKSKGLAVLDPQSKLFLVTVRPGNVLWLVGVLNAPVHTENAWEAHVNQVPIVDITHLVSSIRFASNKGISDSPGKLGMSLQTPRALSDADVILLQESLREAPSPPPAPIATLKNTVLPSSDVEQEMKSLLTLWSKHRNEA